MIDLLSTYGKAFLWTDGYRLTGVTITLWLLAASVATGFFLALPLSVARASSHGWLRVPVRCFTTVFRGTPLYVQLLFFYTGLYSLQAVRESVLFGPFFRDGMHCTILAFSLNTCAYTTEIFAGAINSMVPGEIEAARAFGMSRLTLYRRIILPSALRRALPLYSNEVILMLHATSLAFTATLPDILKIARDASAATYLTLQAFGIAAALYLALSFCLVFGFRCAERRWLAYLKPLP